MFFEGTFLNIDEELAKIDPSKFSLYLGSFLPDEEVAGEMNEFEKKAFIWHAMMAEEMKKVFVATNKAAFYSDKEKADLLDAEFKIIKAKSDILMIRVSESIAQRIDTRKSIAFRGNFQIVYTKQTKEDRDTEIKKVQEAMLIELQRETSKSCLKSN